MQKFCENDEKITYKWFYSETLDEQVSAAKMMMRKMKIRKSLRDEITQEVKWKNESDPRVLNFDL